MLSGFREGDRDWEEQQEKKIMFKMFRKGGVAA